jgi:hypothetical protein
VRLACCNSWRFKSSAGRDDRNRSEGGIVAPTRGDDLMKLEVIRDVFGLVVKPTFPDTVATKPGSAR